MKLKWYFEYCCENMFLVGNPDSVYYIIYNQESITKHR